MGRADGLKDASCQFTLDGKPFRILGGSIHYFRVPREYWHDRVLKMKACGINTLTTYVPWNLHEPERGTWNFEGQLDLRAYVNLAAEVGLWVILRPGPYICAEWDLGGLPSWLLCDKNMQLRTSYPGFMEAVNQYFDKLMTVIKPLLYKEGGPVIALQIENEYGSYAKDKDYMKLIKQCFLSRGLDELLMTSDNWEGLRCGGTDGVLRAVNLQRLSFGAIQHLADMQPQKPVMVMEYWSGWFDVWGEHHHVFHYEDMLNVVSEILERGISINFYMFHGGTSFGFMNGAMDLGTYKPQVTSYDYDAPLSEAGDCTEKYHALRNLFSQYHSEPLPDVPVSQQRSEYSPVIVEEHLSLWDILHLTESCRSELPLNMENLPVNNNNGQSYGYTLYETSVTCGGTIHGQNIRDRALVFVNRQFAGTLDPRNHEVVLSDGQGERRLSLLVENCGRVNYGKALDEQRKGIVGDIFLNQIPLRGFTIFSLEMKLDFLNRLLISDRWKHGYSCTFMPGFFRASLYVDGPPRDTFIKLPGWAKGTVFVNSHNLGRHWSIGPQHCLYCPGPWLNKGENQIIVFEEQKTDGRIVFAKDPEYGKTIDVYKLPFCSLL
ncbi:beta-galactosidase-1-like protein 2 [Periophthalmus magnuspinnatus]|uniref:beta-galactosidase-1-like protein 2 n=1 Tax=Periophthalmus magnuspinnatus TaxID=409849 RepID=UPI002436609A|nr:beta-galactosidase-1-like protein 2 [Periophthalmus magnuspinnatus]